MKKVNKNSPALQYVFGGQIASHYSMFLVVKQPLAPRTTSVVRRSYV
jgi:hypothetical protein